MQTNWKRNTIAFMVSQAISLFGSSLVQYAITWYITLTTQSGVYVTISVICGFLPTLLLSPFAGVWADRYDRKKLIIISDGLIALSTLALALIFLTGYKPMWLLLGVSVIRSFGGAVQSPAVSAMLPDMVPKEQLMRVNGINGSVQSLLFLVAPALAGVLLTATGSIELMFFIDVITAAIAIGTLLMFLKLPAREAIRQEGAARGYFAEIREGVRYIGNVPFLLHMLIFVALINFSFAPSAFLSTLQVTRTYGAEYWRLTVLEITFAAGMLVGGLVIAAWGGLKNRIFTIAAAMALMGALSVLLGAGIPFWVYIAAMTLLGMCMPMMNTTSMTIMQESVDPNYMGRVFSVSSMISSTVMPLGMLIFGPLADRIAIEWIMIGSGVVMLLLAVALFLDGRRDVFAGVAIKKAGGETPA